MIHTLAFKGGYLDFSHLTKLKDKYTLYILNFIYRKENNTSHQYLRIIQLQKNVFL